ncbi:unnamed protein product [Schistosoma margrebowiei]|uniref:Uncharacterized protein n=1 Tax=Schistosoma margrebowiei TaxID=48269 RepID=A0A183LRU7_9TREM|nr:unnamed protein product [Schistosoma margrebowiei]
MGLYSSLWRTSTQHEKHGIQWPDWMQLNDLEFPVGLALLYHSHKQMKMKLASVAAVAAFIVVSLKIHEEKFMVLKYNTENINAIKLDGEASKEVEAFTHLDNGIIDEQGGSDIDEKLRIDNVREAFLQLSNI